MLDAVERDSQQWNCGVRLPQDNQTLQIVIYHCIESVNMSSIHDLVDVALHAVGLEVEIARKVVANIFVDKVDRLLKRRTWLL